MGQAVGAGHASCRGEELRVFFWVREGRGDFGT